MISKRGSTAIGRLLAEGLGGYIAVGSGTSQPTVDDERLDFEVYRAPVRFRSYDPASKVVVYAATIPDSIEAVLSEVALVSSPYSSSASGFIAAFNQGFEEWDGGTWVINNIRIGNEGLNVSGGTARSTGASRVALASTGLSDLIQVAYHGAGGNVEVRLTNTEEDYFSMTFPATAGYHISTRALHEMTTVGTPDVSSVSGVTVIHSGTGSVTMDAVKVTPVQEEDNLIVRQLFVPARHKVAGMPMDIEVPIQL